MASIINADTSGGLKTTADTSGVLQLQSGGTTIATISSTGLAMNTGNITQSSTAAPAFSASQNASQSIGSQVETKVQFNVKDFDTASCYNNSTYRFTPNVAGYYQISITVSTSSLSSGTQPIIYKNGGVWMYGSYPNTSSSQPNWTGVTGLVYLNGSTDYIEAYFFSTTSSTLQGNSLYRFQGFLARSA